MSETLDLNDIDLFLAVAQHGTLSSAARERGVPLPTMTRRMARLERDLGEALFLRGRAGYALTARGRSLADEVSGIATVRARVDRWRAIGHKSPEVKITAGIWTSRFLALNMAWHRQEQFRPRFVANDARLDLARREADIGIRNTPSEHPWLAQRKLGKVAFALYGLEGSEGVISVGADTPSQRWLHAQHGSEIVLTVSDSRLALDLALAGRGQVILPTFIGEDTALHRIGDEVDELAHHAWLAVHQDARHDPPLRAAIQQICDLLG